MTHTKTYTKVWVVGQYLDGSWDLQGVFSTEEAAVEACTKDNYFVGPVLVDRPLPHETSEWPDLYYPHSS